MSEINTFKHKAMFVVCIFLLLSLFGCASQEVGMSKMVNKKPSSNSFLPPTKEEEIELSYDFDAYAYSPFCINKVNQLTVSIDPENAPADLQVQLLYRKDDTIIGSYFVTPKDDEKVIELTGLISEYVYYIKLIPTSPSSDRFVGKLRLKY